jgi:cytosine deaminase
VTTSPALPPPGSLLLRRATLTSGRLVDVHITHGVIDAVEPAAEPTPDRSRGEGPVAVEDLAGALLLPAPAEPHAHLDKAFLAEVIDNPTGDLMGAILAMEANRHLLDVASTVERAERAARVLVANGATAIRTHVDVTVEHGLTSVEALLEVRRRVAHLVELQIVGLFGWPVTGRAGADQRALARDAIAAGIDVVGGCPHLEDDPTAATDTFVAMAADAGLPLDLHTDETLVPDRFALVDLLRHVESGFPHPVTASHCVSLGVQPEAVQRAIAERVAAASVCIVTLPHTNLYLQGRDHRSAMPRGLTAVRALLDAGAVVAAGGDNLQDPFNLMGRGDPFEVGSLAVVAGHLLPHEAYTAVSGAARRALDLAPVEIAPGQPAELVAVAAATVREALAFHHPRRLVVHAGRVVVRDGSVTS